MIDNNIDIQDARYDASYPFVHGRDTKLGSLTISPKQFICIKVYCTEDTVLPCRLMRVSLYKEQKDAVELVFGDNADNIIGRTWIYRPAADAPGSKLTMIFDDKRALRGFVYYSTDLYAVLYGAVSDTSSGAITPDRETFELSPMCCMPYFTGSMRSISLCNRTTCSSVALVPGWCTRSYQDYGDPPVDWSISPVGQVNVAEGENGICRLVIREKHYGQPDVWHDLWVGGLDVIIKHTAESNIRVVSTDSSNDIEFKGVLDV